MSTIIHKLNCLQNNNCFYIKRDDLIPQYYGGNKVRIAQEYYKDMLKKQCDCFITYGSKNSNMCRVIALMCAERNIPCFVVYGCDKNDNSNVWINYKIVNQTGANIKTCLKSDVKMTIERVLDEVKNDGYKPYYIFGNSEGKGNEKTGMEGYVNCYYEIEGYEKENDLCFDYIFLVSGTGITQSGLIAGQALKNGKEKIIGISVAHERKKQEEHIAYCLKQYFGESEFKKQGVIEVYDRVLQGGYGLMEEASRKCISDFWIKNSIPIDHTYIGKGVFGMMRYLDENNICGKNVLFIHTGATPLFFEDIMKGVI